MISFSFRLSPCISFSIKIPNSTTIYTDISLVEGRVDQRTFLIKVWLAHNYFALWPSKFFCISREVRVSYILLHVAIVNL